ncbi:hypothetical protein ACHAXA_005890 [Cyclostephanos tholiformis]|uniref:Crossover junction endonuclease MUS81 n=1 Tax=Cyclostephanos tholiformis TaxID=382380 RepID=A0ABD3SCK2_9STRA
MENVTIDLCDSDEDLVAVTATTTSIAANKKFNNVDHEDDDSSSSSSSSGDSYLWKAGGFLRGSPREKEEIKRGNYFKEVRRKYGDNYDHKAAMKRQKFCSAGSSFGSPIVSLEVNDDDSEDIDVYSSRIENSTKKSMSNRNQGNANASLKERVNIERKFPHESYDKTKSSLLSPRSLQHFAKMNRDDYQETECIEIDLSDNSSYGGRSDKKLSAGDNGGVTIKPNIRETATLHPKPDSGSCYYLDSDVSDSESEFRIMKNPPTESKEYPHTREKTIHTKKKSYDSSDGNSTHSAELQLRGKQSTAMSYIHYPQGHAQSSTAGNNICSLDDGNMSRSSDSTVSLPTEMMSLAMKAYKKMTSESKEEKFAALVNRKGRVSFKSADDLEACSDDQDSVGVEFSFVEHGEFGGDDDHLPKKVITESGPCKEKRVNAATRTRSKLKSSMNDDLKVLDDGSDGSISNSSAELFTHRPFKNNSSKPMALNIEQTATKSMETQCPTSYSSSSKLSTPRAFSPATTSPTLGAYTKRKVPTPAIPAMSPSLVKELGGKLYPDLRHNFLLILTSHARRLRNNSYQRGSFDASLRSIVVIGLHTRPIRSAEAARRIKGVGSNFYDLLKECSTGGKGNKPFAPAIGKYSCVAAAALVALLELEEANASVASANGLSFPLEDLIRKINELLDARANASLNQTAEKYLDPNNLDPGWGQIKKLASANSIADLGGPFIKERKKKDASASGRIYELLENGRHVARKLRSSARAGPAELGPLRQFPDDTVDEEFGAVTMSMDFREGGGGGKSLHKMCDQLDTRGVPYVVRELKIADYLFFAGGKLAPILIERKTAEDVANSLYDGRWERQQRSMRKAQYVLGGGVERRCQICYIIEGDPRRVTVHGGNVGRHNWFQSVEDVTQAIAKLPLLGFSVMESRGILDTIGILAKVAQDVSWRAKNGSIDAIYSYEEFLSRVKVLGDDIGDPPTSREHQNPAPPVVVNAKHTPEQFCSRNDTDAFSPQSDNVQNNSQSRQRSKTSGTTKSAQEENSEECSLKKLTLAQLKDRCKERDENISGKKDDLIARLLKPRKPEILIMRTRRNEYVPKVPSCNAALMVALLLNHIPGTQGMTKERLMVLAEETGVSSESMSGKGGFYDGWAGVKLLLQGDPALVRKEKGHRYSLTTQPPETCGRAVAHALHILAHREGICNCPEEF